MLLMQHDAALALMSFVLQFCNYLLYVYNNKGNLNSVLSEISDITSKIITCNDLSEFENLINQHETIIASVTKQTPVKALLFNDFEGSIKSLGAWGGDFVLATSYKNPTSYFNEKGFKTVIPYMDMVL
mgnify:CR=1 FL=1